MSSCLAAHVILYVLLFREAGTGNLVVRRHVFLQLLSQSLAMLDNYHKTLCGESWGLSPDWLSVSKVDPKTIWLLAQ